MRLAGADVVLFIVGAVLFTGSVYGLAREGAFGGGATSVYGLFNVGYASAEETLDATTFDTQPTVDVAFEVNGTGVQSVTLRIECAHATNIGPASTTISVDVAGPNGLAGSGSGACGGAFDVPVEVFPAPKGGTIEAANEAEARARASARLNANATGDWTATLSFSSQASAIPVTPIQWSGSVTPVLTRVSVATVAPVQK